MDPSIILKRSDVPLISPDLNWEIGPFAPEGNYYSEELIAEGVKELGNDTFLLFYGIYI